MPRRRENPALSRLIRQRAAERHQREKHQLRLLSEAELAKNEILAKLTGIGHGPQVENFARCNEENIIRLCRECGTRTVFRYKCNLKWCPTCNWRIAEARRKILDIWSTKVTQPKHLVLTMRNFEVLTRRKIGLFQKALARLRRQEVFRDVAGGCMSIELTNENRGWHLHAHCLLDARWLDMPAISKAWGELVDQEFGIVHVSDLRGKSYTAEVCKYVVKGSELAKWQPEQIWEFLLAIRGRRFFFQFGSLFHRRAEIKRELLALKRPAEPCDCGCSTWVFKTELDEEREMITRECQGRRRPR